LCRLVAVDSLGAHGLYLPAYPPRAARRRHRISFTADFYMTAPLLRPLAASPAGPLRGTCRVPGDKSISHRALILGALATGRTRITGLLESEDVINTARAVTALGAPAHKSGDVWEVLGRGVGGLSQPSEPLDFGNSGTGARLMMGVIAGHPITVRLIGDQSL